MSAHRGPPCLLNKYLSLLYMVSKMTLSSPFTHVITQLW